MIWFDSCVGGLLQLWVLHGFAAWVKITNLRISYLMNASFVSTTSHKFNSDLHPRERITEQKVLN